MWKQVAAYATLLALGTLALQWLDYQWLARVHTTELTLSLVAGGFLVLGLVIGARVIGRRSTTTDFDGNPRARQALGISPREIMVLEEIAAGHSNKQIAARLHVSPNTVKTHVARLFDKLGARRRTQALRKARELGLLP